MPLFASLFTWEPRPVEAELGRMAAALRLCPHEGEGAWEGSEYCGLWLSAGREAGPAVHEGCHLVGDVRIDNRDELRALLAVPPSRPLSDPDLALAAYLKWGEAFAERLYGRFAVAVYDARAHRLVAAVDHLATAALLYVPLKSGMAVTNHLPAARDVAQGGVNERYLMRRFLMVPSEDPETPYKDVRYVPPGHVMAVVHGGNLSLSRYWFPTRIAAHRHTTERETLEGFLDVYRKAVAHRLPEDGRVAAHLSGGLDSGSVTALAAEALRARGLRLTALTGTALHISNRSARRFEDEAAVAAQTAAFAGNVDQVVFACPDASMAGSVHHAVTRMGMLGHGVSNLYWIFAITAYARAHGYPVVLNGQVGNMSVSWKGIPLKQRLTDWAKAQHLALEALLTARARWRTPLSPTVEMPVGIARPFDFAHLHPDFLARFTTDDLLERTPDALDDEPLPRHIAPGRMQLLRPRASGLGLFWQTLGQVHGITNWDPTDDRRLIEYTLGVPESFFCRGMGKHLVRAGMKGLMPDAVRLNRAKGIQSPDMAVRLVPEVPAILRLIDGLPASHPAHHVLHLPTVRASFVELAQNPQAFAVTGGALMRHLGYLFLTGVPWEAGPQPTGV